MIDSFWIVFFSWKEDYDREGEEFDWHIGSFEHTLYRQAYNFIMPYSSVSGESERAIGLETSFIVRLFIRIPSDRETIELAQK